MISEETLVAEARGGESFGWKWDGSWWEPMRGMARRRGGSGRIEMAILWGVARVEE